MEEHGREAGGSGRRNSLVGNSLAPHGLVGGPVGPVGGPLGPLTAPSPRRRVWTPAEQKSLEDTRTQAFKYRILHYRSEQYYARIEFWIGLPTYVVHTLCTAAAWSAFQQDGEAARIISGFVGFLTVFNFVLKGISDFMQYSKRRAEHRAASDAFSRLSRKIHRQLILPLEERRDCRTFVEEIDEEYARLKEGVQSIPEVIILSVHTKPMNEEMVENMSGLGAGATAGAAAAYNVTPTGQPLTQRLSSLVEEKQSSLLPSHVKPEQEAPPMYASARSSVPSLLASPSLKRVAPASLPPIKNSDAFTPS